MFPIPDKKTNKLLQHQGSSETASAGGFNSSSTVTYNSLERHQNEQWTSTRNYSSHLALPYVTGGVVCTLKIANFCYKHSPTLPPPPLTGIFVEKRNRVEFFQENVFHDFGTNYICRIDSIACHILLFPEDAATLAAAA